ncbi:hypothetical protein [Marivirga sp.]|uniref:hypothetical protein n=1 Tax=Marivirga sp. TaxID=2018662 RepID=UPI0025E3434E|nr:hypothetical protein [Marivirga sp.]
MQYCRLLILILFLTSCDVNDETDITKYILSNESSHEITLIEYYTASGSGNKFQESYYLDVNAQIDFISEPENWTGPLASSPFLTADSIVAIFDDTLSIMYDRGRLDGNPIRIDNYKLLEGEEDPYVYLFEFTNEDYERALERGRIVKP